MNYIEALQDAIFKAHGCKAQHLRSIPVNEQFKGKPVWQGIVEVFELTNHPKAKICYAWGHHAGDKDDKSRYVTVLEIPPVDSPLAAVRASIVSDYRN
ncbi:MAG: hypothetical protein ABSF37_03360 [Sedimentisphaerales bacterium]|jgi:hypothetical protein